MLSTDINSTGIKLLAFPGKRNSEAISAALVTLNESGHADAIPVSLAPAHIPLLHTVAVLFSYFVTLPIKLVLSPLIDGLGQGAWRNMLRRTQMLFHRESELDVRDMIDDPIALQAALTGGTQGAGYKLFHCLNAHLNKYPNIEMTLIGHSMGTIVLNRALREIPDFRVRNIVYMAAACSIDDFRTSVIAYLQESKHGTRFYNLSLHPAAENRELQKNLLDITPRGSLLVWIDNFLSDPVTTLDRTLGAWENAMQTAHVIPRSARPYTTFKAFGIGDPCHPTTHGAFTDAALKFWHPDFWRV
jgi:hypothetical protein